MGELPCSSSPLALAWSVITEKTTTAEKEMLNIDYDDHLSLYESQFRTYMTWLDEDARAGSVLIAKVICCCWLLLQTEVSSCFMSRVQSVRQHIEHVVPTSRHKVEERHDVPYTHSFLNFCRMLIFLMMFDHSSKSKY
jgi:hypothetical protein